MSQHSTRNPMHMGIIRSLLLLISLFALLSCTEGGIDTALPDVVEEAESGNTITLSEPSALALASAQADFTIVDAVLVSKERVGRTVFEYSFQLTLTHNGAVPVTGISAQITSSSSDTVITDMQLDVGDLAAGETVTTVDTFSFEHDRSVEFSGSTLTIDFSGPVVAGSVRYVGRYDDADPDAVRLSWSGTGFIARFHGTGASVTMRGGGYYTVVVDGVVQPAPLVVSNIDDTYILASGLADGEHTIEVYRRPEAAQGLAVVSGVQVQGVLLPVPEPSRLIEVVGDSWSTGYGVEGPNGSCNYNSSLENQYISWGAIAARAVQAEFSNISYNGIGVMRNFLGQTNDQMLDRYDRVIASEPGSSGTIRPVDAVLIDLGANDFVGGALPPGFDFGYAFLLELIRNRHPDALIAAIWPRLPSATETTVLRTAIESAIAQRAAFGDTNVVLADIELADLIDFGCDFHPGPLTHEAMAQNTITFLNDQLGW